MSIHFKMSAPHLPPVGPDATTPLQSQEMTVSALTTDSILVDLSVDSGQGEDAELLSLTSIFHCHFIKENANSQNGKVSWWCKWCGKKFTPRHQSRALKHVLKITCGDIAICTSAIPKNYEDRYHALYDKNTERSLSRKRLHTQIDDALMMKQSLAVANLLEKCGVVVSGGASSSLSVSIHSAPSVQSSIPVTVGGWCRSKIFFNGNLQQHERPHTVWSIFTAIHLCIHPEHGHPQVPQCHSLNGNSWLPSL